jgi:hypothetical protein
VALLTPEFLRRLGLSPQAKVLDLKGRVRCRGCRTGIAVPPAQLVCCRHLIETTARPRAPDYPPPRPAPALQAVQAK